MTNTTSQSLIFVCQNQNYCLKRIASCLQDPKASPEILAAQLLSLPDQTATEKAAVISENDQDIVLVTTEELNLSIIEIRQIQGWINLRPVQRQTRLVIFPQAEKLTPQAQNAMLKTLEEPPANTIIILVAKDPDILLPTIISRCQIINLSAPVKEPSEIDQKQISQTLALIKSESMAEGFSWAKNVGSKRLEALNEIDKLLLVAQKELVSGQLKPQVIRRLFKAKEYLCANTNVRLTLENLFLNC